MNRVPHSMTGLLRARPFAALLFAAALGAAGSASAANGGPGQTTLAKGAGGQPVTVLYPTDTPASAVQRGPFSFTMAPDAPPARGNGRLVVLSHGSGGSVWMQFDLAAALVAAGFTVAMPLHAGDNFQDASDAGPVSWARRPQEVSQSIDAVAADPRFAPLQLDFQRVGAYGMSAGGITALTLAGARWSPALLARHCEAHIADDFAGCMALITRLTGNAWLDSFKLTVSRWVIRAKFGGDTTWREWKEPRIAAVVSAVPVATPIDPESIRQPRVPLALVRAGKDAWLAPRFHSDAIHAVCAERCPVIVDMPTGGHGSILSPQPIGLPEAAARLLDDPPGFDRAEVRAANTRIVRFFVEKLGSP